MDDMDVVLANLADMLAERGEDVSELTEHAMDVQRARFYSERIALSTPKTTVFFVMNKALVTALNRDLRDLAADEFAAKYECPGCRHFVLVAAEPPSPMIQANLAQQDRALAALGGSLQLFVKRELMYNPSRHELTPKHLKLTPDEVEAVKETYMLKSKAQLPAIHRGDVMAKWLGLRQGDVVRITRYNETSGEYYYYRHCV